MSLLLSLNPRNGTSLANMLKVTKPSIYHCCSLSYTKQSFMYTIRDNAKFILLHGRWRRKIVPKKFDLETLKMVFKSLNGDAPSYMSDMFTRVSETTSRVLRNSDINLRTPMLRTSAGQGCFSFRGASLWNGLQKELKGAPTLKKFQEGLMKSCKV